MGNVPSWLRWPPNCCETCISWSKSKVEEFLGVCTSDKSMEFGTTTDSRFRCPSFIRKKDV